MEICRRCEYLEECKKYNGEDCYQVRGTYFCKADWEPFFKHMESLKKNIKDYDPEFRRVVDENFWELI